MNFVADANNPIVFHVHKKGSPAALLATAGTTSVPKDGTPVGLSLSQSKVSAINESEVVIQCWTDDQNKKPGDKFDWRVTITVPSGGLQEITNEFSFLAPEAGYQQSVENQYAAFLEEGLAGKNCAQLFFKAS